MSGFKSVSLSDIQRAATSGRRETEKRSKIEKENTIE